MDLKGKLQGLDWLIEEVEASLQQAAEALEAYVADPDDETQIRFCLGYIHQVNGSLQIAECHGPLLLSEEMESLAVQLQNGEVNSVSESCDVLIQAILRLPNYVRHVIATRNDQPETLLLLLNELRAVRAKPLVTEGAFFSPVLNVPVMGSSRPLQTPNPQALGNLLRKLRQMYQFAVLGIIKGEKLNQNFSYADKVFSRLQELSKFSVQYPLWEVAKAFLENISGNNIPIGVAVKVLFRELDAQIKLLVQGGVAALNTKPPEPLLKNLLFYVAYGGSKMPVSEEVRKQYQLDNSLPDGVPEAYSHQYQPETLQNIVKELDRELDQAKKQIESYVLGDCVEVKLLEDAGTIIQRMSDTLAVVGELPLRNKLKEIQAAITADIDSGGNGTRSQMMSVATGLVEVEAGLFSWMDSNQLGARRGALVDERQFEVGRAQETLIREARNGLETIKESIVDFIASQWDRQRLEAIPPLVDDVAAAMDMLNLPRAQRILKNSNRYLVEQLLDGGVVPDWNSLDSLADAITSIDYYLELLGNQDAESDNTILVVAENSVAKLGYPVGKEPTTPVKTVADIDEAELSRVDGPADGGSVSEETEVPSAEQPMSASVDEAVGRQPVEQDEEELVDPEIIEIFIEEVGEVLAAINELLPVWAADPDNHKPLIDIRRSFHTLKGSGRMVAADHIGDLGWAVESLLNKVLDHQLEANAGTVHLVEQAVSEIPGMIKQFESSGDNRKTSEVIRLIDMADALACGEEIVVSTEQSPSENIEAPAVESTDIQHNNEVQEVQEV
ncbi:MAG: Hpt domain-containing protein, partial [Pseudomonadales bacterium]|nr:Hpt domain-containing protein [Pseudomonadales bacterium]